MKKKTKEELDTSFEWYGFRSTTNPYYTIEIFEKACSIIFHSEELRTHLQKVLSVSIYTNKSYPFNIFLTSKLDNKHAFLNISKIETLNPNFQKYLTYLYKFFCDIKILSKSIRNEFKKFKKLKYFADLSFIFKTKDQIFIKDDANRIRGAEITSIERVFNFFVGFTYKVEVRTVTFANESYKNANYEFFISSLKDFNLRKSVGIINKSIKDALHKRGEKYVELMTSSQKCWYYDDECHYISRLGLFTKKIKSKIITDAVYHDEINSYGSNHDSIYIWDHRDDKINNLSPELYWMLPSQFKGISLKNKIPYLFDIEKIQAPTWNKKIFDELELDEKYKNIILSCVKNYKIVAQNLVDGKNDGIILLLNGPPGVGKTLTAEAVSELTERPLYKISIGDLGTDVSVLEECLQQILERATFWNAILLIDEADVFLEKRSSDNIEQNYYVSIFLRLLEYFDGIMFLTTNRVENIDPAFLSRITIPLNYKPLTEIQKISILKNMFKRNGVEFLSEKELQKLSELPLNGRQFGSVIKIAISIAHNENRSLTVEDIENSAKIHTNFEGIKI